MLGLNLIHVSKRCPSYQHYCLVQLIPSYDNDQEEIYTVKHGGTALHVNSKDGC